MNFICGTSPWLRRHLIGLFFFHTSVCKEGETADGPGQGTILNSFSAFTCVDIAYLRRFKHRSRGPAALFTLKSVSSSQHRAEM